MKRLLIITVFFFSAILILPASELSENAINGLQYMFEEEKLARDIYTTFGDIWDLRVFQNISRAEERHMSMVEDLSADYGLVFTEEASGDFSIPELQDLYNSLFESGSVSLEDALEVGRLVEITDIDDLDRFLSVNPPDDYRFIFENLRQGSVHHLEAFNRQLGYRESAE